MSIKHSLRRFANKFGIDFQRYPGGDLRAKMQAIERFNINLIFDIGANCGQYAQLLRELGYNGKIVSFEPLKTVFQKLEKSASKDDNWYVENVALGNKIGHDYINVSKNTVSSSLLNVLPSHYDADPGSVYVDKEKIEIKTLDSVFANYYKAFDNVLIKIDAQGYEKYVLEGAMDSLKQVTGIQMEMSLIPLYEGTPLFVDMIGAMERNGFRLYGIENGFGNLNNGQQLQIDGTFYRSELF